MNKILYSLLIIGFANGGLHAQVSSIATWKNNATGCYNFIHDDYGDSGVDGIWKYADTIASNRGISFTFGAITSRCEESRDINGYSNSYEYAKEVMMNQHGHEIMNHSHTHDCAVGRANWPETPGAPEPCNVSLGWGEDMKSSNFNEQLVTSTNSIFENTGHYPRYFIFPYDRHTNAANDKLKELGYIGSRTGFTSQANSSDPSANPGFYRNGYENHDEADFYPDVDGFFRTAVIVKAPKINGENIANELNEWAQYAINNRVWVNREMHNVGPTGWGRIGEDEYRDHLNFLESKVASNELWIGTISEILTYQIQKLNYTPTATYVGASNSIDVNWSTPSFDVSGYLLPLTIKSPITLNVDISQLGTLQNLSVTQNGVVKEFVLDGATLSSNVFPHEGRVIVASFTEPCLAVCIDAELEAQSESLLEGEELLLTILASGEGTLSYNWFFNDNPIANTGNSLKISKVEAANSGDYYVVVSNEKMMKTSRSVTITIAGQAAYNGVRHWIPGKIENWKYDEGGAGLAYFDKEALNQANSNVRNDQVDIGSCSDAASDYAIGYNDTDDWLEYSVFVEKSGVYKIDARLTTAESTGKYVIQNEEGENISEITSVASTGSWDNWKTQTTGEFYLHKGNQVLRFYITEEYFDICAMTFVLLKEDAGSTVDFTVNQTEVCTDGEVIYTDASGVLGVEYSWDFDGQIRSGKGPHTIKYSKSGFKTVELTVDGQSRSYSNMVEVIQQPSLMVTDPLPVCSPNTVDITNTYLDVNNAKGLVSYWVNNEATIPLTNAASINETGTYFIKMVNESCEDIASVEVAVIASPDLKIIDPIAACLPNTVDITDAYSDVNNTNGRVSYWMNSTTTTVLSNPNSLSQGGTYYIKMANEECENVASVNVSIDKVPSLSVVNPSVVCSPSTVDITNTYSDVNNTNGVVSYWENSGVTMRLTDPTSVSLVGTYYVKILNGACEDVRPVVVSINTTPNLSIEDPSVVCSPSVVDITDTYSDANNTNGNASFWVDDEATIGLSNPSSVQTGGLYYVKIDNKGCQDIASVKVRIIETPNMVISNPSAVCSPNTVNLTNTYSDDNSTEGNVTYWMNSSATVPLSSPSNVKSSGTYYIKIGEDGCSDLAPVVVQIDTKAINISAGSDIQSCDEKAIITALQPSKGQGTWSKVSGSGSISSFDSRVVSVQDLNNHEPLIIRWAVSTNDACPVQTSDVSITRSNTISPEISISSDFNEVCNGEVVNVTLSHNLNSPSITWIKNASSSMGIVDFSTEIVDVVHVSATVSYDDCGSPRTVSSDPIVIRGKTVPVVDAGEDQIICEDDNLSITLSGSASNGNVQWFGGTGVFENDASLTTAYTPTEQEINSGSVVLTLIADNSVCSLGSSSVELTFTVCNGITMELKEEEVSVYPNPFIDEVIIDLDLYKPSAVSWEMVSVTGEVVLSDKLRVLSSGRLSINTEGLNNGIYIVQVKTDDKTKSIKVVRK
jgi:hypothetical protein